jgi:arylsulfatase A-like enzyme
MAPAVKQLSPTLVAAVAGVIGGLAGGLIDSLWSARHFEQYISGASGVAHTAVFVATSYALAAAVIAALVTAAGSLYLRWSDISSWLRRLTGADRDAPSAATAVVALLWIPVVAVCIVLAFRYGERALVGRMHAGLVVTSAMSLGVVAVLGGSVATLGLGGIIARYLPRSFRQRLEHPLAAPILVYAASACALATTIGSSWKTSKNAPLAPLVVMTVATVLVAANWHRVAPLLRRLTGRADSGSTTRVTAFTIVFAVTTVLVTAAALPLVRGQLAKLGDPRTVVLHALLWGAIVAPMILALSAIAASIVERFLLPLAPEARSRLADPSSVRLSLLVSLSVAAGLTLALTWSTARLLPLRLPAAAFTVAALTVLSYGNARHLCSRLSQTKMLATLGILAVSLSLGVLAAGSSEAVRKAAHGYTGVTSTLTRTYRRAADFDRDGYSAILGGGDCDNWNRDVHPGARDIPDDGIDQNCVGGDPSVKRNLDDLAFAAVPDSLSVKNVLLITIDTLRADHVGAYGYDRDTSPAIDEIAAQGTLFLNAWAHAPSTRYSMPAILTGRPPLSVYYDYSHRGWPGLQLKNLTIAEVAKSAGLYTAALLNYWYFDPSRQMNQGFDVYDNKNKILHKGVSGEGPAKTRGSSSKEQTDKAVEFLDSRPDKPFHLWVHYYDPHFDYEKHPESKDFGDSTIDIYDNEIRYTDDHIGRLIDELKKRNLYDSTAIVITGDHGEGFGEHGIDLHGYHLYAAQTKVPLIIRVPGSKPRQVYTPVAHADILPTIANLLGAEPSTKMMGRSLVDLITGTKNGNDDRIVFQQLSYENRNEYRGAASKNCHVLYNVSPHTSWEAYRIDTDPLERVDVINDEGPCREVRRALEAWYDTSEIPEGAVESLLDSAPKTSGDQLTRFGDDLELLEAKTVPRVRAGKSFELELTFAATGRISDEWRIFAHFEADNRGRFTADHHPVRPFSWWRDGQFIRYRHTVVVPKRQRAGSYTLWLGLFRGNQRKTASSRAVRVEDNRAAVLTIEIEP